MGRCIKIFNNLDIAGTNQSEGLEKGSLRSSVIKILSLWFVDHGEVREPGGTGEQGVLGRSGIVDIYQLVWKYSISMY